MRWMRGNKWSLNNGIFGFVVKVQQDSGWFAETFNTRGELMDLCPIRKTYADALLDLWDRQPKRIRRRLT